MFMTATYADCRFEARITSDTRALLKHAAELQGRSMSEFVISAAREAAQKACSCRCGDSDAVRT
ncbi:DUF1778 domain-containing protein [Neisseria gonorrhoeae]